MWGGGAPCSEYVDGRVEPGHDEGGVDIADRVDCRARSGWPAQTRQANAVFGFALPIGPLHRHADIAAEFLCEIDRYTGVDTALPIREFGMVIDRHDRAMPDVRMDVESAAAVALVRDELLWGHIVPR
jgi:hypothetical protein